jgi:hypothetical protein
LLGFESDPSNGYAEDERLGNSVIGIPPRHPLMQLMLQVHSIVCTLQYADAPDAAGYGGGVETVARVAAGTLLCSMHSTVCTLQYALCSMHSAVCTLQYALYSVHSAVCTLQYALCSMHSAVCTLQYALCRYSMHSTVCTLQYALRTIHYSTH